MFFGEPPASGKFYKGLHSDTPVNHDLHWADRVKKENHMVKAMTRKKRPQINPDMFVKRPWTEEETQQLRDAIMKHGPNNWEVVCRDRTYIEMIGNHTMEDIKTKWRTVEKARLRSRKNCTTHNRDGGGTHGIVARSSGPASPQKLNILNQLKLKQTLKEETQRRAELQSRIRAERAARLEAEKKAAIQLRERRKMESKLQQLQQVAGMGGSYGGGSSSLARAGSSSMIPVVKSIPRRAEDDMEVMQARLSSRSTAIQQSAATRLRARAVLDSVRSSRR